MVERVPSAFRWVALAVCALGATAPGVTAHPDACVQSSPGNYLCGGNQSGGVTFVGDVPSSATTITITNLSTNVAGPVSAVLPGSTATFTLMLTDPTYGIAFAGGTGPGMTLNSTGDRFSGSALPAMSLVLNSPVSAGGNGLPAISVTNSAATGGTGGTGFSPRDILLTIGTQPDITRSITMLGSGGNPVAAAVYASSKGGDGGTGSENFSGGTGGLGARGGQVTVSVLGNWSLLGNQGGMQLVSTGGRGGNGGTGDVQNGGDAALGGDGGPVTLTMKPGDGQFSAHTNAAGLPGLQLLSQAGDGGTGGRSVLGGLGGLGGGGGSGGNVTIAATWNISTEGANSPGISAHSLGGIGGNGGDGGVFGGRGGYGGDSGFAGSVTITANSQSTITTTGPDSPGVQAQSIAGHGGSGGSGSYFVSFSAAGGSAGPASLVSVDFAQQVAIRTVGDRSPGLSAQSIGGGGGTGGGGFGLFFASGGSGGNGGHGGTVWVTSFYNITTSGDDSPGIYAQSIGGAGGDGGWSGGLVTVGGKGFDGSFGGDVSVTAGGIIITGAPPPSGVPIRPSANPICDTGCSSGIVVQSIGGGGGNGGSTGAWFPIGGSGGGGGIGGDAKLDLALGTVETFLPASHGVLVQSIGGGGGTGGVTVGAGPFASVAIGGSGGGGGNSGLAYARIYAVQDQAVAITTHAANSPGVAIQSLGGGGGNGSFTLAVAAGRYVSAAIAIGGTGGSGGQGGSAQFTNQTGDTTYSGNTISTFGDNSPGLKVQSIGGGGGNAGFTLSASGAVQGVAASVAIGGSGGDGGSSGGANVWSNTAITTRGADSQGMLAQSIGGGGGTAGITVAGSFSYGPGSLALAIGGSGGGGGNAASAFVTNSGTINTSGARSDGLVAESLAGGGGRGGITIAGAAGLQSGANFSIALGGSGGSGGLAGGAIVTNTGNITTTGANARPLVARSVGGGGGDASITVSSALTAAPSALAFGIGVGGRGARAGDAYEVQVTNSGNLTASSTDGQTSGTDPVAPGLTALSIGGGGGSASWTGVLSAALGQDISLSGAVAVGGSGGSAGAGYHVEVTNSGTISTAAPFSDGILASSIGGGGGNAGYVLNVNLSRAGSGADTSATYAPVVGVGGTGGGAGIGSLVTIANTGAITTAGQNSSAINATSLGGGGGSGGYLGQLDMATGSKLRAVTPNVTVGGGGGSGASADQVKVTNSGRLTTTGADSPALQAQSLGGGGGNATMAFSLTAAPLTDNTASAATISVGGAGGSASTGGDVTVVNNAGGDITTSGARSAGIIAASIGGGGGNASTTMALSLLMFRSVGVSVGGTGGTGANAGTVSVTNHANITTTGQSGIGIVARSIGGGGGNSQSTSVSLSGTTASGTKAAASVSVGMTGAGGGGAGPVSVNNSGAITTSSVDSNAPATEYGVPLYSYGILAQSVGGGGGTGGTAQVLGQNLTPNGTSLSLATTVGGRGGGGGPGNTVTLDNAGAIQTYQVEAHALYAQSVGGGGGKGGNAISLASTLLNKSNNSLELAIAVGGSGGGGSTSAAVTVTNSGTIETSGAGAHGIYTQSIGGGGGDGGSAFAFSLGWNKSSTDASQRALQVAVGGTGGSAGHGGDVTVTNSQSVTTHGDNAFGIYAHSIGGGGGEAGSGSALTTFPMSTLSITIGGSGGVTGDGGVVSVTQQGARITTSGEASAAIYAQSVGGGGGRGGVGVLSDTTFPIAFGGPGGSTGNGGKVTVTATQATITTNGGNRAYGIFAQSVGGGGGEAGGVGLGIVDTPLGQPPPYTIGTVPPTGSGGGTGSGADVSVTLSDATITTKGSNAIGILAQSVGGGGGISGQSSAACTAPPCTYNVGTTSGTGDAGHVGVALTNSSITTSGQYAHGIFAQSAAGRVSTAHGVSVQLTGATVTASGPDASAIFLSTTAGSSTLPLTVSLDGTSSAVGGTGTGAAIRLIGGDANTITNAGTITGTTGITGIALRTSGTGTTTVTTSRFFGGSVAADGGGSILIINQSGGKLMTGPTMDLGPNGGITNAATLEPAGMQQIGATAMTGTLTQTPSGTLVVDVSPPTASQPASADTIAVDGSAQLAGTVVVQPQQLGVGGKGRQTVEIVTATQGISTEGLMVRPSAVGQYALARSPSGQGLALSYELDFANPSVASQLRSAQLSVARYLAALHGEGSLPDEHGFLLGFENATSYAHALDRLSPEAYATTLWNTALSASRFADTVLDCRGRSTAARVMEDGHCIAAGFSGMRFNRNDDGQALGYRLDSVAFNLGAERQLTPEWAIGFGLGFDSQDGRGDGHLWTTRGDIYQASVFARRSFGDFTLTALAHGGVGSTKVRRYTTETTSVSADQDLSQFGGLLRAEQPIAMAGGTLKLLMDFHAMQVSGGALAESGSLGRVRVNSASETMFSIRPGLEWNTTLVADGYVIRPRIGLALLQFLSDPSPAVTARFDRVGSSAEQMRVETKVGRSWGQAVLGLDVVSAGGVQFGAEIFGALADGASVLGGSLRMRMLF